MACVEYEPISGTYVGYTPLPDATAWKLEVPGGITVEPDGKVGLLRVTVCPRENQLIVEQAHRPGDMTAGLAKALRVRGMGRPMIILNGGAAVLGADGLVNLAAVPRQ